VTWYLPAGSPATRHAPSASVVAILSVPPRSRTTTVAPAMGRSPAAVTTRPESTAGGGVNSYANGMTAANGLPSLVAGVNSSFCAAATAASSKPCPMG